MCKVIRHKNDGEYYGQWGLTLTSNRAYYNYVVKYENNEHNIEVMGYKSNEV